MIAFGRSPRKNSMNCSYMWKEDAREKAFGSVWMNDLDAVFSDVADYYDRANNYASLGLLIPLRRRFVSTMDLRPGQRVLDVCAGTNAIGIDLLRRQPGLEVYAMDRSVAMQEVGRTLARANGFEIKGAIGDVHSLPFPDNYFDVVTLQWASRHLRVIKVFSEIHRVLKPGGHFYHCDMLRPANKMVEEVYCLYLKGCLSLISRAFGSGPVPLKCRRYFVQAIRMFYSTAELSHMLAELGYRNIVGNSVLSGTVAFHKACKA
jgi:demethylmenaquinone methyltransferase/2-methoxy-6-polyprenyl-1,4-benzoquinol methylase